MTSFLVLSRTTLQEVVVDICILKKAIHSSSYGLLDNAYSDLQIYGGKFSGSLKYFFPFSCTPFTDRGDLLIGGHCIGMVSTVLQVFNTNIGEDVKSLFVPNEISNKSVVNLFHRHYFPVRKKVLIFQK